MESLPPAMPVQQPTSGLAIASVICGPLGFLTVGLSGIAAVITGHMALGAIKRSGGMLKGSGMAIAGLITGYISILILPIAVLAGLAAPVILKQRHAADRTEVISNVKILNLSLMEFEEEYGSVPADKLAANESAFTGYTGARVLEQLKAAGIERDVERLLAVRGEPGANWYYYPGLTSSDPPMHPVLISPKVGDKIVILRVDGSAIAEPAASLPRIDTSGAVEIPAPVKKKR